MGSAIATTHNQRRPSLGSGARSPAIDSGITLFDTAEVYGPFHFEELLGKALGARRTDVVLETKVGFKYSAENKNIGRDATRDSVMAHAEGCLKRRGTDWLHLLLIHWPDHATPFAETIAALETLKAAGKIRYYGGSTFTVAMMEECEQHGHLTANQIGYHLFGRRMEREVLPCCGEKKIGYMADGTLAFGLLTGAFTPETTFLDWDWRHSGRAFGLPLFERESFLKELRVVERLKGLATRHGKTMAQLAIAWAIGHPALTVALVGIRKPSELKENVHAIT